ncbi:hypothetical protein WJX77_012243 [Trebouxia sp. C0004]
MPLKLFSLSVSGGNAAVLCDSKALFSAVERAAGPVSHHGMSYRLPLLVTDLPSRKAAGIVPFSMLNTTVVTTLVAQRQVFPATHVVRLRVYVMQFKDTNLCLEQQILCARRVLWLSLVASQRYFAGALCQAVL